MGHGMKALALAAALGFHAPSVHALAWQVEGFHFFWFEVPEARYLAESLLTYSARVSGEQIEDQGYPYYNLDTVGADRVNGGPWTLSGGTVVLWSDDYCNPKVDPWCVLPPPTSDFLKPVGAINWDAGQFQYFRLDGEGTAIWWEGGYCEWEDATCSNGMYFSYGWDRGGTATLVPEPASLALLGLGLAGLGILGRRRKAA